MICALEMASFVNGLRFRNGKLCEWSDLEMASFVNGLWFRYGKLCEWSVVWKWQAL